MFLTDTYPSQELRTLFEGVPTSGSAGFNQQISRITNVAGQIINQRWRNEDKNISSAEMTITVLSQPTELTNQWIEEYLDISRDLKIFEEKYGISSKIFLQNWKSGDAADTSDHNEWAILLTAKENLLSYLG